MKAADYNFNLIDSYLRLLNTLSPDNKLELIARLSDSLKGEKNSDEKSLSDLFGSFISHKSAEQIINELKAGRNFSRTLPEL